MPFTFNQAKLNNLLKDFFANNYDKAEFEQVRLDHTNRINKIKNLILSDPFTEYELTEILKLTWATKIWANTEWLAENILKRNKLSKLEKYFKLLVSPNITLANKYKLFNENIQWLGAAFVTEILCHLYPNEAGIWNSKSATFLEYIEAEGVNTTKYINYRSFNQDDYNNFNLFLKQLLNDLNNYPILLKHNLHLNDLLELNYLLWKLYDLIPEQYKTTKKVNKTYHSKNQYKSYHEELKHKLTQIGQWLGFETKVEKPIAAGSRVDVIWEARVANLGKIKYVFEVQHKGSIDSLIINLQKAKNIMPEVQKLIIVSDKEQIQKIKKHLEGMSDNFKKAVKFWEDTSVEQAHLKLEALSKIIRDELELIN